MVTVTGFQKRKNSEGGSFLVLTIEGGVMLNKSETSGNWFASTMKTNIVASMDENSCQALVGQQLPGTIIKKEVKEYAYTIPSSGEQVILNYKYEYVNDDEVSESVEAPEELLG